MCPNGIKFRFAADTKLLQYCNTSILSKISAATVINLLAPEFLKFFLAHRVCKMWIIQEPKKVALWNKRHFEEKEMESVQHV
jgi:hypothetical protein